MVTLLGLVASFQDVNERMNDSFRLRLRHVRATGTLDTLRAAQTQVVASLEACDRIAAALSEARTREALKAHVRALQTEGEAAWQRHALIRDEVKPDSEGPVRRLLRHSWMAFMRLRLMARMALDSLKLPKDAPPEAARDDAYATFEPFTDALGQRVDSFEYVRAIEHRCELVFGGTGGTLGTLSVSVLMLTAAALVEALDHFGWSPSAGLFMSALVDRYGLLIHDPGRYGRHGAGRYAALTEAEAEPLLHPARLRTAILDSGERLFFHLLWYENSLRAFVPRWAGERGRQTPLLTTSVHAWGTWRLTHGLPALVNSLTHMSKHPHVGAEVQEFFHQTLMQRFILPGEMDHYVFEHPEEATSRDASNTLFVTRHEFFKGLQRLLQWPIPDLMTTYAAGVRAVSEAQLAHPLGEGEDDDGTVGAFLAGMAGERQSLNERLVLLAFEVTFDTWVRMETRGRVAYPFAEHAFVDDRSTPAPQNRPPLNPAHAREAMPDGWPLFVAVHGIYAVIGGGTPTTKTVVMATPHLVDALSVWLREVQQHGYLPSHLLREAWAPLVAPPPPYPALGDRLVEQ
jgi:hypothetical protein